MATITSISVIPRTFERPWQEPRGVRTAMHSGRLSCPSVKYPRTDAMGRSDRAPIMVAAPESRVGTGVARDGAPPT